MDINIGEITAACGRCGGKDFQPPPAGPLRLATELTCTSCGNKTKYLVLLDQIGEEAMRRANKAIDELKKRPRK